MLGNLKVNFHCSRLIVSFKHNLSVVPVNSCGKGKETKLTKQRIWLRKACGNIISYIKAVSTFIKAHPIFGVM